MQDTHVLDIPLTNNESCRMDKHRATRNTQLPIQGARRTIPFCRRDKMLLNFIDCRLLSGKYSVLHAGFKSHRPKKKHSPKAHVDQRHQGNKVQTRGSIVSAATASPIHHGITTHPQLHPALVWSIALPCTKATPHLSRSKGGHCS